MATKKTTIAVFGDNLTLVGYKKVTKVASEDVAVPDECDLPTDGSYKWDLVDKTFVPLGHGFGKPNRAPISDGQVLYLLAKQTKNVPQEVRDWCTWYEDNMLVQQEELNKVKRN